MARRHITKVKFKEGRVEIHAKQKLRVGDDAKTEILNCSEEPADGFKKAFGELETHVRTILQLPDEQWQDRIQITGVSYSFSEDTEVEGAVITGFVRLDTSHSPFSFNTPHLPFEQYSATGESPLMPEEAQDDLRILRREAELYLDGKRAQGDLFTGRDGKMAAAGEAHA